MREVHEYRYYQARVRKPLVWLFPRRMWKKWVRVGRWTDYERERLISEFEEGMWPTECRGAALNPRFQIEGRDAEEDEWEPVSEWRRERLLIADDLADALLARTGRGSLAVSVTERGRRRGSGIDTLVRHLRDKASLLDYRELVQALRGSGIPWIVDAVNAWGDNAVERARDAYARGGAPHKGACEYCEWGLPPELEAAIPQRKYR